jgi:uncharacterized protein (UPF0276 family)
MRPLVGGSLRKVLGPPMLELASRWRTCEVVPENWDPADSSDRAALSTLNATTTIQLHSLSINVLGPAPAVSVVERIREWSDILGIGLVTDHFCWSGTREHALGVFVPPVEEITALQKRVRAVKKGVGITLGLENICLSSHDPFFNAHYHHALAQISVNESVPVLLDLENLRLDALASGLSQDELLSYYDEVELCGYHVAGSSIGDQVLDTHDQKVPDATLQLLLKCYKQKNAPVIYERDYALDVGEIDEEVRRIGACIEADRLIQ